MSVWVSEDFNSRELRGVGSLTYRYTAGGSSDIEAIATAVVQASPESFGYYQRQWLDKTMTPLGGGCWKVEIPYGLGDLLTVTLPGVTGGGGGGPGGSGGGGGTGGSGGGSYQQPSDTTPLGREWSVDYSQGTRKVTKSIKFFGGFDWNGGVYPPTTGTPADSGSGPYEVGGASPPKGAPIGFDPNTGEVTGLDVPDGIQRWQLQAKIPAFTMGYGKLLESLQFCVNSRPFLGRAVGEVMFIGTQFGWKSSDGINGTYTFDMKRNKTNIKVGDRITIASLRGWDYLEVFYDWALKPEGPEGEMIKKPRFAAVHQVCEYADLNQLF